MMKSDPIHWLVFYLAMILLAISCHCLVFETLNPDGESEDRCHGGEALLVGWIAILGGQFAWFANPLMLAVGVLLNYRKRKEALVASSMAVLCGLWTFISIRPFPTGRLPETVLLPGAWFWFAAIGLVWLSSLVAWRNADDCASESEIGGGSDGSKDAPVC